MNPWTVAQQAPPSMASSRQRYWHGLPFLSPGALPDPGLESGSPALQVDPNPKFSTFKPFSAHYTSAESGYFLILEHVKYIAL